MLSASSKFRLCVLSIDFAWRIRNEVEYTHVCVKQRASYAKRLAASPEDIPEPRVLILNGNKRLSGNSELGAHLRNNLGYKVYNLIESCHKLEFFSQKKIYFPSCYLKSRR